MKIISWNVNGYRAVLKKGFADFLNAEKPDILCLQETKVCGDQLAPADTAFPGYTPAWRCADRRGYSGVGVFFRRAPLAIKTGFGEPRFDNEGRTIWLEYPEFHLLNVYFPNGGQGPERVKYKLEFYEAFLSHIEKLRRTGEDAGPAAGKAVIFCGDVNTAHKEIDLARPKENEKNTGFLPVERAWLDKITEKGWVDAFRAFNKEPGQYTWWDYKTRARERNVGWRIDYFFVNREKAPLVKRAFLLPAVRGSDHCPLGIELDS